MSEGNRTPTGRFVEVNDVHRSGESASEGEDNLRVQLLDRRMSSCEFDRKINAIIAPLSTQLEKLIQSVSELCERNLTHLTEGNAASGRSRLSVNVPTDALFEIIDLSIFLVRELNGLRLQLP